MVYLKTLKPHIFYTLLKNQKPSLSTQPHPYIISKLHKLTSGTNSFSPSSHFQRTFSTSAQLEEHSETDVETKTLVKGTKGLDVLFKEAVGLSERVEEEEEEEREGEFSSGFVDINQLKKSLRKIEREVRMMKGVLKNVEKKGNGLKKEELEYKAGPKAVKLLDTLFKEKSDCEKKVDVTEKGSKENDLKQSMTELSPEMVSLLRCLHEKGYLKKANFMQSNKFDLSCFSTYYSRTFLQGAAEKFGRDHQELLAKLLSEEDVKRFLLFGCPSVTKKSAFAAKRLRSYFNIRETMVCRPCKLNNVCEFANHIVGKKADEMNVGDLMRSLTSYGFGLTHSHLTVPDEIKDSVSNLLKQVVTHSQ